MTIPVLTIDGPSGAGKGTISRLVAQQLGWHYLDSGSIYRSLAVSVLDQAIALDNVPAVIQAAQDLRLRFDCGKQLTVWLNDVDISDRSGLETTGNSASIVAAIPQVRQVLLQKQKDFRQLPGLVADGRDMGTVVFPDAPFKVYLTASADERAKRRYKQLKEKGIDANLALLTQEIETRDRRDTERATAPLAMAEDAVFIDSSEMPLEAVLEQVLKLVGTGMQT